MWNWQQSNQRSVLKEPEDFWLVCQTSAGGEEVFNISPKWKSLLYCRRPQPQAQMRPCVIWYQSRGTKSQKHFDMLLVVKIKQVPEREGKYLEVLEDLERVLRVVWSLTCRCRSSRPVVLAPAGASWWSAEEVCSSTTSPEQKRQHFVNITTVHKFKAGVFLEKLHLLSLKYFKYLE